MDIHFFKKYEKLKNNIELSYKSYNEKNLSFFLKSNVFFMIAVAISIFFVFPYEMNSSADILFYLLANYIVLFKISIDVLNKIAIMDTKNTEELVIAHIVSSVLSLFSCFILSLIIVTLSKFLFKNEEFGFTIVNTIYFGSFFAYYSYDSFSKYKKINNKHKKKRQVIFDEISVYEQKLKNEFDSIDKLHMQEIMAKKMRLPYTESFFSTEKHIRVKKENYKNFDDYQMKILEERIGVPNIEQKIQINNF